MTTPQAAVQSSVECPQCGKHTVVELSSNTFRCLNCSFEKDFSKPNPKHENEGNPAPIIAVIVTIILLLMI